MKLINKKIGQSNLEAISQFAKSHKVTYAGRLDPMAEGLLIALIDEEVHDKDYFLKLDKTYEIEVLFGLYTDTCDTLGIITNTKNIYPINNDITKAVNNFIGQHTMPYPSYSSKSVNGKPLWWWAKNNKLEDIKIPSKQITIYEINNINIYSKFINDVSSQVIENISKVKGNFRQNEVISSWENVSDSNNTKHKVVSFSVRCSSGTYMRWLACELGKILDCPSLALSIKRTKIGEYSLN